MPACQRVSQQVANRGKADVHARQKQHQSNKRVQKAHLHPQHLPMLIAMREQLKKNKYTQDGNHAHQHFTCIARNGLSEDFPHFPHSGYRRNFYSRIECFGWMIDHSQQQNRQDGTDAAKRHQTEAVAATGGITSRGGQTDAHRHDKRNRYRACRYAARIKSDSQKFPGRKQRQQEQQRIEHRQHLGQIQRIQHAHHRNGRENANAHSNCVNQHPVWNGFHLIGKHLKIRLGNRDQRAHQKRHQNRQRYFFMLHHLRADALAQRRHGHFSA